MKGALIQWVWGSTYSACARGSGVRNNFRVKKHLVCGNILCEGVYSVKEQLVTSRDISALYQQKFTLQTSKVRYWKHSAYQPCGIVLVSFPDPPRKAERGLVF